LVASQESNTALPGFNRALSPESFNTQVYANEKIALEESVPPVGFEPTTPGLKDRCYRQLSYESGLSVFCVLKPAFSMDLIHDEKYIW
jgi:hypothetical protein